MPCVWRRREKHREWSSRRNRVWRLAPQAHFPEEVPWHPSLPV